MAEDWLRTGDAGGSWVEGIADVRGLKGGRVRDCDETNHRQKQLIKLCREGNWGGVDEKGFG
jgi:hypothetical protein